MRVRLYTAALLLAAAMDCYGQEPDFKRLSLEELARVDVSSVSRRAEPLNRTPAAVTIVSSEDIRRSGATNIREVLRLVPGLDVARFNAGSWAISSRGFNATSANKLLVMIDGRTVYSPIFAGTFWEIQDLVLEDIERIEIVRGPGATLWETNAINGIISIITKSAHQTRYNVATASGGGADDLAVGSVRVGNGRGADLSYRAYAKYSYNDGMVLADGEDAGDDVRIARSGFRLDWARPSSDFTLQGDVYDGVEGIRGRGNGKVLGGNLLGRYSKVRGDSEYRLQMYYERDYRRIPLQSEFWQHIFDVDFQHQFTLERHSLIWGAGFRSNKDTTRDTPVLRFRPIERSYPMLTAFIQDEVSLAQDRVRVTFGSKFIHNDFSGFEVQPSVRANWTVNDTHTLWGAVTRAVRIPTRFDTDIEFGPPGLLIAGNPNFDSERVIAYELGYRTRIGGRTSIDVATFVNDYNHLRTIELAGPGRASLFNNLNATNYGVEVSATYDVSESVRVRANYSRLNENFDLEPGQRDLFNSSLEANDPRNQFQFTALANLPHRLEADSTLRFVGALPLPPVPRYTELDARFGWNPNTDWNFSIVGRNLLHAQHPEFGGTGPNQTQLQRNVYGRITFRF